MKASFRTVIAVLLVASLTGCLGTMVQAPTPKGDSYGDTRVHLIGSSTEIDARSCPNGLHQVTTWVPLWGVAVGILTFGIIVPMTTVFTCSR